MIPRTLEPEAMDTPEEARDYDAMDHSAVNSRFVADFLELHGGSRGGEFLDVGTGPGRIPVLLGKADPGARILGVDLAEEMLVLARYHVANAGLADRIRLQQADGKRLPFDDGVFEAVLSNTIVHHVPEPGPALAEMARVLAPGGSLFVRDLARPDSLDAVTHLVATYASHEGPEARALFEASLHAGLTVEEVRDLVAPIGIDADSVAMTSDRHWTIAWRRPV